MDWTVEVPQYCQSLFLSPCPVKFLYGTKIPEPGVSPILAQCHAFICTHSGPTHRVTIPLGPTEASRQLQKGQDRTCLFLLPRMSWLYYVLQPGLTHHNSLLTVIVTNRFDGYRRLTWGCDLSGVKLCHSCSHCLKGRKKHANSAFFYDSSCISHTIVQ